MTALAPTAKARGTIRPGRRPAWPPPYPISGPVDAAPLSLPTDRDVRHMSPRAMASFSLDLYVEGLLGWEDYTLLAFQPELHPDYETTIGALTGVAAEPDRPRDHIRWWEARLRFEREHPDADRRRLRRTARILALLRRLHRRPHGED